LRIGKLPTEVVAFNISQGVYNKQGVFVNKSGTASRHDMSITLPGKNSNGTDTPNLVEDISPRVQEMVELSNLISKTFK